VQPDRKRLDLVVVLLVEEDERKHSPEQNNALFVLGAAIDQWLKAWCQIPREVNERGSRAYHRYSTASRLPISRTAVCGSLNQSMTIGGFNATKSLERRCRYQAGNSRSAP
jgi:hypothetical protein